MKTKARIKGILVLSILLASLAFTIKPVLAQESFLSAPILDNPLYGPGDTFTIDITVDDVTDLWSFNFTLSYDTSILTAVSYTINTNENPPGGYGFRNFFSSNEINDMVGYVKVGADRGPSGNIVGESVGTGDGIKTIYFLDNPRILSKATTTMYLDGVPNILFQLVTTTGRVTFTTAPGNGVAITADYVHPGLTTTDPFSIVEINFSIDARGVSALDLQGSELMDINMNPITTVESDGSFDNRFHGHIQAPDYVNGALMPGDEFDIVITADHVRAPTWGVSFFLDYDTNVLTAETGIVDDVAGNTFVEVIGLSLTTVDPVPLVTMTFMVDAGGWSPLHLRGLTAVSIYGDPLVFSSTDGSFSDVHDVAVADVEISATEVAQGDSLQINATVANQGNFTETFDVTVFYDSTAIVPSQSVTSLASGETQTLTFYWDTTGVAAGDYTIKAVASTVPSETDTSDNTLTDGTVKIILEPVISLNPTSGAIGTKVEVTGIRFGAFDYITLTFDDMLMAQVLADSEGAWTAVLNVPLAEPGAHLIKAVSLSDITKTATFRVIDTSEMEINIEVGQTHFRGEIAEFYIQTAFKGEPIDATSLTATLRKPDGTTQTLTNQHIATGLYKTTYTLPTDAPTGTYVLVAEADYVTGTIESKGTKIGSFLESPTLTGWNAVLISIEGTVATVKTDVGLIKLDLDAIDPMLTGIETNVDTILGKVLTVQGDVATIKTDVGTIKTTINGWTGATISSVVTPTGTFNLLALTTSSSLDSLKLQDDTITVEVSGPAGTTRTTNVVLPKQFLAGIGTTVGQIEATVNDQKVNVQHTEDPNMYVISISYTPGANTIKIFLTGMPPPSSQVPIETILLIIVAIIAATSVIAYYVRRTRRKTAKL